VIPGTFEATTYKINAQFYKDYNATKNLHCTISLVLEAKTILVTTTKLVLKTTK
jgi:hypothetical protein